MSFASEIWSYLKVRKKWWLLPMLLMMALLGGLLVLGEGTAIAPLIYTIF